ncbi:acetate--CoA ligase [Ruminococcaceae bacterium OttesenSCG-928-O06]|nr:acetate--CoA ligase [Ruminococcaceae bacterium OttesenSCG-928-O06]
MVSNRKRSIIMPPQPFVAAAHINDPMVYQQDAVDFWAARAAELSWTTPPKQTLSGEMPNCTWFSGGTLNASYNCLDRHLKTHRKNKAAIIFEGEHGDTRVYTYKDLHREVCRFANVLKQMGANRSEYITIFMPMIPDTVIAMLACARLGVPHNVIFGGFSAQALLERINDAGSKILITCDGAYRKGRIFPVIENVNQALESENTIETVIIVDRIKGEPPLVYGRDHLYRSLRSNVAFDCPPVDVKAEDPLFLLYVSGPDGAPKGVLHSTGGYLTGVGATHKYVFDIEEDDVYWCTADVGWISGHSYGVYGPLLNGATIFMYEGAPDYPDKTRCWKLIENHGITIMYTTPTLIRSFIKWGEEFPQKHDLSSLRLLGSVGEPISSDSWLWFYDVVGKGLCPIVDTWWQTETGMIMLTTLPAVSPMKPGSTGKPFPGTMLEIFDEKGKTVTEGQGVLTITQPWPSMPLGLLHDDGGLYEKTYWKRWKNRTAYYTGDGARIDKDGYIWVGGRIDDVLNISGHRLGISEVENCLTKHEAVAEAACVGIPHDIKGQVLVAFIVLKDGYFATRSLIETLRSLVAEKIGAIAQISEVIFTAELPKTQTGKTVRRLLQAVAEGKDDVGDLSILANPGALDSLRQFLPRSL